MESISHIEPILETERMTLRPLTEDDLDFVAMMLGHPEVMRYWPRMCDRAESLAWIHRQREGYAAYGHAYWLALDRITGQPLGQVGLLMCEVDGVAEPSLGYMLHRPYWRRGLAVEAAEACLRYGLETLRYPRLTCLIRPENIPSLRVAARLGLMPVKLAGYKGLTHLVFVTDGRRQYPAGS